MIFSCICVLLQTVPVVLGVLGLESTYYEVTNVRQFNNYGSIELFEHNVPEMTSEVGWRFETGMSDERCPIRNITVLLQHGSYPLPPPTNNKTYPEDFYLQRSSFHRLELNSTGNLTTTNVLLPTAGRWFGATFVDYKEKNDVIKAINDLHCSYYIRVNVTTEFLVNSRHLIANTPEEFSLTIDDPYRLYRFFVEENIWNYDLRLTGCSTSDNGTNSCPLEILARGSGLPTIEPGQGTPVHTHRCQGNGTDCVLSVVSPLVGRWHYVKVALTDEDVDVSVTLSLQLGGCQVSSDLYRSRKQLDRELLELSTQAPSDVSAPPPIYSTRYHEDTEYSTTDSCGIINSLQRIENMNNAIYAVYSLGPGPPDELVLVSSHEVELVQFDVLPIKDSGGTLLFKAYLAESHFSKNDTQNVTVHICLSLSRIPTNGSQYYCPPESGIDLALDSGDSDWMLRKEIPYPEPGPYFVGFQATCYVYNNLTRKQEPCLQNYTEVVFEITNGPCVNSSCDGHGECYTYRKGAYIYSACSCIASYRGYTCEDGSETDSESLQMLYTLLLSLSNLFFIPACVVCVYRRYYTEAIVYFANMFFSGFYHACDMSPWSIYKLCIAPYHVLQYCDFLLSILSFWVTLIAMSELPPTLVSVCHMAGVIALAMGVEWGLHSTIVYVVVIAVGVALVVVMWIVRSARRRRCYPEKRSWLYMLPGFVLAVTGLVVFAFVQNDVNYPYTHSAWHMCIALSIVFLLPNRKMRTCFSSKETNSDRSSDEFEFDQRRNQFEPVPEIFSDSDRDHLVSQTQVEPVPEIFSDSDRDHLVSQTQRIMQTLPQDFDEPEL